MAAILHLLKRSDTDLARVVIEQQLRAGDRVTVAVLPGGSAPDLPTAVTLRRVPGDVSYAALLELVFSADHVIAW